MLAETLHLWIHLIYTNISSKTSYLTSVTLLERRSNYYFHLIEENTQAVNNLSELSQVTQLLDAKPGFNPNLPGFRIPSS